MRVLIVDDQARTRQSLHLLLNTVAAVTHTQEASNGLEALELVPAFQPHLVVMDALMPRMDGIEATHRIKACWPQVKVILLSMYPEYREYVRPDYADAFVSKGEPPERLLDVLQLLMGQITAGDNETTDPR
jgi:two-component system response regulator YesN